MKYICSLIVVEDINKARYFYEEILSQVVQDDFGENIFFEGGFAIHKKDHYRSLINNYEIKKKANNFELYFEDNELEVLENKLKDIGIEFIHKAIEQPWRQKVMRFYDYDGNIIEVGENMTHTALRLLDEGLSIEEVSEITYLPKERIGKTLSSPLNN